VGNAEGAADARESAISGETVKPAKWLLAELAEDMHGADDETSVRHYCPVVQPHVWMALFDLCENLFLALAAPDDGFLAADDQASVGAKCKGTGRRLDFRLQRSVPIAIHGIDAALPAVHQPQLLVSLFPDGAFAQIELQVATACDAKGHCHPSFFH